MDTTNKKKLGKLSAFGITEPWQTSFLLPERWDDFSNPLASFKSNILSGTYYYFRCRLDQAPKVTFKNKVPRLTAVVIDEKNNRGRLMSYGDKREFEKELNGLKGGWFYLYATLDRDPETGQVWVNNAEIIPPKWHDQLRPRYPGKPHVIGSTLVRDRVLGILPEGISQAAAWLEKELSPIGTVPELMTKCELRSTITLENMVRRSHTPLSIKQGKLSQECLMKLAAIKLINSASNASQQRISIEPIIMRSVWGRLDAVGFAITTDQKKAVQAIVDDLESGLPTKRLLSGDVATGKTIVYALAAAAAADNGRTIVIMLPTAGLVAQVSNNMQKWWPDLHIQAISGDSKDNDITSNIIIGTTALLHRRFHTAPDLLVIDEQHKYSREQREQLMAPHTHLLEVSATPIPRTQALLRYGMLQISRLTKRHNKCTIDTNIWSMGNTTELSKNINETLNSGQQLLVIYAKRDKDSKLDLKDIHTAYEGWQKKFPGRVRMVHGAMKDHEKTAALAAMEAGLADILVSTIVIETGVDLSNAYRILIVDPDRYGLVTLHQLRGRVARQGGQGYCDLLLTKEIATKAQDRLNVFCKESDGFKLAELDMRARGIGNISSDGDTQSGTDESFLFGRSIDIDVLDKMIDTEKVE